MTVVRALVAPLRSRASAGRVVYLLIGVPMALAYVVSLVAAAVLALAGARDTAARMVRAQAEVEEWHLRALAGVPVSGTPPVGPAALAGRVPAGLLVRGLVAAAATASAAVAATVTVTAIAVPFADGFLDWGDEPAWRSSAGWASAWTVLLAVVGVLVLVHLVTSLPAAGARLTARMLAPDAAARVAEEMARLRAREVELSERAELARMVHDSVGHAVTVAGLQAVAAREVLDTDPEYVRRALGIVDDVTTQAMAELDRVLAALNGDARPSPPVPDIRDRAAESARRLRASGHEVRVSVTGAGDLPRAVAEVVATVLHEGTTNVLRHSSGGRVEVAVHGTDVAVTVEIVNEVGGVSPAATGGRGLSGLTTRVTALGGALSAGPSRRGWVLRAEVPIRPGAS